MEISLRKLAREKYNVNPFAFICLGVFFCIFSCLCVALSLLVPFLGMLAIILLAIPLLFGIIVQTSSVDFFEKVEFKNVVAFSMGYFRPQFYGCFRLLICLLKAIVVELVTYIVVVIITALVARGMHPAEFDEAFTAFRNYVISSQVNNEQFEAILSMHGNLLLHIHYISLCGSALAGYFTFIMSLCYNTIGVYFRTLLKPTALMFGKYSINSAIKANRRVIYKDFLILNWPLILLGIVGALAGGALSIYLTKDYINLPEFGLIGALLLMSFYFPMYLANMNALYEKYKYIVILGVNKSIKDTIEKIQRNVDLSEEDRQRIEDTLKECNDDIREMEENNKKDSDDQNP